VTTLAEAKQAASDPANWKMDLKTGLVKQRQIRGGTVRRGDLRAFQKATEIPKDWLNVEGVTDKPDPGEAPPVGATANFPGVFDIIQKGSVEHGAKKPFFIEYFLHGNQWGDQRWTFRMLGRTEKGYADLETGELFEDEKQDTLPPGQEEPQPRGRTFWVLLQADPEPYVLSKSAIEKDWLPPEGTSALPKAIRDKVPEDLRYWKVSGQDALDRRRKLAELDIRELGGTETKEDGDWQPYRLQRHWWRGRSIIIRWGASTEHYDLRVALDGKHWHLVTDGSPLEHDQLAAYEETKESGDVVTVDGKRINVMRIGQEAVELAPDQPANPTKDTPAFLQTVDEGQARVIGEAPEYKKLEFKGGKLRGAWIFRREEPGGDLGTFSRSGGPETKSTSDGGEPMYTYTCEFCQKDFESEVVLGEPTCRDCEDEKAGAWVAYRLLRRTEGGKERYDLFIGDKHYLLDGDPSKGSSHASPTVSFDASSQNSVTGADGEMVNLQNIRGTVKTRDGEVKLVTSGKARQVSKSDVDFLPLPGMRTLYQFKGGGMYSYYGVAGGKLTQMGGRGGSQAPEPEEHPTEGEPAHPKPESVIGEAWPLTPNQGGQIGTAISWTPEGGVIEKDAKAGRRLSGEKLGLLKEIRDSFDQLMKRLGELVKWGDYAEEQPQPFTFADLFKGDSGFAVKEVDGKPWLFTWSSNAFEDRQGEKFSTAGLETWADRLLEREHKGSFNLWHIPASDFAEKRLAITPGRFLAEAGPFLDDKKGQAALAFFRKYSAGHPTLAPEGWGCSVEFRYLPEERKTGTFDNFEITRTSVIPRYAAANLWTQAKEVQVTMALSNEQKEAAKLIFGEDLADQIFQEGEQRTKELEEAGVAFKSAEEEEGEKAKAPEEEKADLSKFKSALNEIAGMVKDDDATAKAIKDVAGKLTEDNMKDHGRTLKMLAGKLKDDLKSRLGKIADAMTKGEGYPAPGQGYGYPAPKGKKEGEPVEVELDIKALAEALGQQFKADVMPLAEALATIALGQKGLEERLAQLEKANALKQETELPRFTFKMIERASQAEETAVKEGEPLLDMKPKETTPKDGSLAATYFGH
jgi:hypothetical protein